MTFTVCFIELHLGKKVLENQSKKKCEDLFKIMCFKNLMKTETLGRAGLDINAAAKVFSPAWVMLARFPFPRT